MINHFPINTSTSSCGNLPKMASRMHKSIEKVFTIPRIMKMRFIFDESYEKKLDMQELMCDPIELLSETVGYTMCFHQAKNQTDANRFVETIVKEVSGHIERSNQWNLIPHENVLEVVTNIPSVWSMK